MKIFSLAFIVLFTTLATSAIAKEQCFVWTENPPPGPGVVETEWYQLYMDGERVGEQIPYGTTRTCNDVPADGTPHIFHLTAGNSVAESLPSVSVDGGFPPSVGGFKITIIVEPI